MTTLPPMDDTQAQVRRVAFRSLLEGGTVDRQILAAKTGLDPEAIDGALVSLSDHGRVVVDGAGAVVAAGGLSLLPTRHRLVLGGRTFYTWCAIDAITIPAAIGSDAVVETACARCGRDLAVAIKGGTMVSDPGYVAFDPAIACSNVMEEYCPEANLFCSPEHLRAWRSGRGNLPGRALSLGEVEELGRDWWSDLARTEA